MQTRYDSQERVVSLSNLKAMCDYHSAVAHRYWIEKVTRSRVWVGYSNPDEYGTDRPIFAIFPSFPNQNEPDNPSVVLTFLRVLEGEDPTLAGEGW